MTYQLVVKPKAEYDLQDGWEWYEQQKTGLGDRYLDSIDSLFLSIRSNPLKYQLKYKSIRMALAKPFPIAVYYTLDKEKIFVLAVLSTYRNPRIWEARN